MKLGIYIAGMGAEDLRGKFEQAREAGFSLCMTSLHRTGYSRQDLAAIADDLVELGIRPLALGCFLNPLRPEDASFMGACANDLDTLLQTLDIVGARRIVLCSGTYAESPVEPDERNSSDEGLAVLREFVAGVLARTRARNYQLVFEPNPAHVLSSPKRVLQFHEMLGEMEQRHVRYVLDGAAFVRPEAWEERDGIAQVSCAQLGAVAGIAYLRDAALDAAAGLLNPAPGEGELDFPGYVATLQKHAGDTGAVIRSVTPDQFADVRDRLLRWGGWELV